MAEFPYLTQFQFFYSLYTYSSYEEGPPVDWYNTPGRADPGGVKRESE
jgi:hypothetical protein